MAQKSHFEVARVPHRRFATALGAPHLSFREILLHIGRQDAAEAPAQVGDVAQPVVPETSRPASASSEGTAEAGLSPDTQEQGAARGQNRAQHVREQGAAREGGERTG